MSYYSALLQNIDNQAAAKASVPVAKKEAPPKAAAPQKKPEETQSISEVEAAKPAVVEKPEGNDGGVLGQLIKSEVDHTYVPKSGTKTTGSSVRIFAGIRKFAGPAALAALGLTCQFFFSKVLVNRAQFLKGLKPTSDIKVNFYVDFAPEGDSQVRSVPLKHFEASKRKALGKFWFRVVSEACQQKGKANESNDMLSDLLSEKKTKIRLNGGFSFKVAGERGGPFYTQRDLTSTLPWLNACIRLIADGKKQEVGAADGSKVVLSRFGLGGNRVKVETVFPNAATNPAANPSVHYFQLPQFCIAIHAAAKEFLPLVGTCVQELPKGTAKEDVESGYVDREKILKDLLKHKELGTALNNFESKLHDIPGPEVTNYMREQTVKKVRVLKQQAKENENIRNFFFENVADGLSEAKKQAEAINAANEAAKTERQAAKVAARLAALENSRNNNNKAGSTSEEKSSVAPVEEKEKKSKKIVKKVQSEDGFKQKKTFLKKGEEEVEVVVETPPPVEQSKKQKNIQRENVVDALDANPFAATKFEGAFQNVAEEQYNATLKKVNLREQAQHKQAKKARIQAAQAEAQAAEAKAAEAKSAKKKKPAQSQTVTKQTTPAPKVQQSQKGQQQPQKGQQQPQKGQQQPQKGQQQPQKGAQQPATQKGQQQTQKAVQSQQSKAQPAPQPASTPKPKQPQQQKGKQQPKGKNQQKGQNQPQTEENVLFSPPALAAALAGLVAFCYVFVF